MNPIHKTSQAGMMVASAYAEALDLLQPLLTGAPTGGRFRTKRIAIRLLELASAHSDLLITMVLLRATAKGPHEHALRSAATAAALVTFASMPRQQQFDLVVAALTYQMGADTHGAFAKDQDAQAQRRLLNLFLSPVIDRGHLRTVLASFQFRLGLDGSGLPKLRFPVLQHPLALFLSVIDAFVTHTASLATKPRSAPLHMLALDAIGAKSQSLHHPAIVALLNRVVGPCPVGTTICTPTHPCAKVIAYQPTDNTWKATARSCRDATTTFAFDNNSPPGSITVLAGPEHWGLDPTPTS